MFVIDPQRQSSLTASYELQPDSCTQDRRDVHPSRHQYTEESDSIHYTIHKHHITLIQEGREVASGSQGHGVHFVACILICSKALYYIYSIPATFIFMEALELFNL